MSVPFRFAVVDMYAGYPNQGLACIVELLRAASARYFAGQASLQVFSCRGHGEVPTLAHDVVICSGGPGDPWEGQGSAWEAAFFGYLDAVLAHNAGGNPPRFVFAICHSFELLCRHLRLAQVVPRRSPAQGVLPVHLTAAGEADEVFREAGNPLLAADFREWQVVSPDAAQLRRLGAQVLAREKPRPHVPLERAVMAVRVSPQVVGVQFHPEAEPRRMWALFSEPARRREYIARRGQARWEEMMERIRHVDGLGRTYRTVIPSFLAQAVRALRPDAAALPHSLGTARAAST